MNTELLIEEKNNCPRCKTEMSIRKRPDYYREREGQKYYFARWYQCPECKFRKNDNSAKILTEDGVNAYIRGWNKKNKNKQYMYHPKQLGKKKVML